MPAYVPLEQRFWYHVTPNDETGCWEWTGSLNNRGYGRINIGQKVHLAHRVVYGFCVGPIPDGKYLLHSCDNGKCVNPFHLSVGTQLDNMRDMTAKGRARHPIMRPDPNYCRAMKHEWVPENIKTVIRKDRNGTVEQSCKRCEREKGRISMKLRYHRKKAGAVVATHSYTPDVQL